MSTNNILTNLIEQFSAENLVQFFRNKTRTFAQTELQVLTDKAEFSDGLQLGEFKTDISELVAYCFKVNKPLTERTGKKAQYELAKKILKQEQRYVAGIFVFYDDKGDFRFSLVYDIVSSEGKLSWSNFRRFTYFVSKEQTNKTFIKQIGDADFSTLKKIKEAFSVEPVTNQFYEEIQNWYFWAMDKVEFPADEEKDKEKRNAKNLIRMITRIIFIWFMKAQKLIPSEIFDKQFIDKILNYKDKTDSTYYKAILQNLFFATLNTPMKNEQKQDESPSRIFVHEAQKRGYRNDGYLQHGFYRYKRFIEDVNTFLKTFENIPFLNGGLFDCLDKKVDGKEIRIDCFSDNPKNEKRLKVPDELFFLDKEISVNLSNYLEKGTNKKVTGLFEILNKYNFTIDENTPVDQEVALDPELLGKVFENLLAAYVPETATTARKATGSYYTPREIVDYMVDESLTEYLTQKMIEGNYRRDENRESLKTEIRKLLSYEDEATEFDDNDKKILIKAIEDIKILDPACGSGAFPMGILHKLVLVLHKLDPENKIWKEQLIKKASPEIREELKQSLENKPLDYIRKLGLIEHCIYGIDIQEIAIQISKLRFFISLLVEQVPDDTKPNRDIKALPNLETKFVAANSLIDLDKTNGGKFKANEIIDLEEKLFKVREEIFYSNSRREKVELQKKEKNLREKLKEALSRDGFGSKVAEQITSWDPFDQNTHADWFDPEWMFGVKNGFDIVIANPPYVRADNPEIKKQRDKIKKSNDFETLWEKWDLYVAFIEKGFKLLAPNGILEFIIPDAYMTSKYAIKSHKYFLEKATINRINFCSDLKIFEASVRNIIIEYKKVVNQNHIPKRIKHINRWDNFTLLPSKKQSEMGENTFKVDTENKSMGDFSNTLTWREICYVSYGLRPSSDERWWKGEFKKEDLISDIHDKIHSKPYIEGKWIKKHEIEKIKYLEWGTERSPKKLVRPTFPELYVPEKILKGRMTEAVYDNTGLLCNDSVIVSVLWKDLKNVKNRSIEGSIKKDFNIKEIYSLRNQLEENSKLFNLKYLLAILNSKIAYNFLNSIRRSQIGFYPDDLKKLPIKKVSNIEQKPFIGLVDQIIAAKKENPQADTKQWEEEIDRLVYELYGLTEEEIRIVEK